LLILIPLHSFVYGVDYEEQCWILELAESGTIIYGLIS